MKCYIPLSEAANSLDKHQIFFYLNDKGEKVGGLNQQKVESSAGDRDLHVSFHDVFHGHLLGAEHNCPAKKLKEGAEPMTYNELLEVVSGRRNSPTIYHYGTRGADNGASPIYQQGSFNKEKIEHMAQGRPINQTPLNLYKGHLCGTEFNK
jgi:hypothetical protein